MTTDHQPLPASIQARLAASGLRRTLLTRAVVGYFLAHPHDDLCHSQALAAMDKRGLKTDRVTLYRLLDRLAACGVLVRHTHPQERVWRYRLVLTPAKQAAPAFECRACQQHFALDALVSAKGQALNALFSELMDQGLRDLSIRGVCSGCANVANTAPPGCAGPT